MREITADEFTKRAMCRILDSARREGNDVEVALPSVDTILAVTDEIEALAKISFPVEQGHRDHGKAEVGCGAQGISGKDAEAAAIGGHRGIETHLHGKIGDNIARSNSCRRHVRV